MPSARRSKELDCLRCVAVFLVLCRHLPDLTAPTTSPEDPADAGRGPETPPHSAGNRVLSARRSKELDCLRCVAVFLVLCRHLPDLPDSLWGPFRVPVHLLYEAGWAGVDLFFVLSGFLISGLLFREHQQYRRIDFKQFLVRRGLKVYPSFYCLIA